MTGDKMQIAKVALHRPIPKTGPPTVYTQPPAETPVPATSMQLGAKADPGNPARPGFRFEQADVHPPPMLDEPAPAIPIQLQKARQSEPDVERTLVSAVDPAPVDGGTPLPITIRAKMERALGVDFSSVRVHESKEAAAIGALAYARGNHLHFAPGAYRPFAPAGQRVIGHELTHVVQQRQHRLQPTGHVNGLPVTDNPALETEADILGQAAAESSSIGRSSNVEAAQSAPSMASLPIQAMWRNKRTGESRAQRPLRGAQNWEWVDDDADMAIDPPRGTKRARNSEDSDAEEASSEEDDRIDDPDFFTATMKAKEGRYSWDLDDIKSAKNTAPQDATGRWCPGCGEPFQKTVRIGSHGRKQKGRQLDHWGVPLAERKALLEAGKPWQDSSGTRHKVNMNKFRAGDPAEAQKLRAVAKQDVRMVCPGCNASHSLEHTPVGSEPFWGTSRSGRVNQGVGAFRLYRLNDPADRDSDDEDGTTASISKHNAKAKKGRKRARYSDESDV